MPAYQTVAAEAVGETEMKKSHFIGQIAPVASPEAAAAFLENIRAAHKKARHHVHAYVLTDGRAGFSDDGEPQGTAGKPLLDVINGARIANVCIVVTRYFGGVLLGTGGLVRAYGEAAKLALDRAEIITMQPVRLCGCAFDYTYYGRIGSLIADCGGEIENTVYRDCVDVAFYIPEDAFARFSAALSELTLGSVAIDERGGAYRKK